MYISIPVLAAIGAAFLILLAIVLRRGARDRHDLSRPPVFPEAVQLAPDVEREVRALLARGAKIDAIRLVREATPLDLKSARELVERMK